MAESYMTPEAGIVRSYYIWTIGCQMNKADSERLESALGQMGLSPTEAPGSADVIVLNSCVVRQSAEDKVVGMLSSLKPLKQRDPAKVVALMGCMVGPKTAPLEERFPYVDVFMRPQQYDPLIDLLGERMGVDPDGCVGTLTARPDVTAYIPIIHGCDKFCTFCIIPYRRGREVSRTIEDIVRETQLLAQRGVKEVTLLGQNVDSYGHDLPGQPDLGDLLAAVNDVDGLERVRFLTSHPNDMSDHIIESVAELDKVCKHINLPFQAGDDEVLARMRRGYTNAQYRRLIEKIRARIPGVSLSTDLIVGFCGETDAQFQRSVEMVRDIRFDKVHTAAYSTRPGTIASRTMEDDVPQDVKEARLKYIDELQEHVLTEINAKLLGKTLDVLVEGRKRGKWYGRSRNDKLVFFEDERDRKGELVNVRIDKTSPWSLQGSLVESTDFTDYTDKNL
jgi:tRNA-2-methylthio-N6-dimethylallyladenosine synthase